jgi:FkbM family methyltransferase
MLVTAAKKAKSKMSPAAVRWWPQIWSARQLAPTRPEGWWMIAVGCWLAIKHRMPLVRHAAVPVRIRDAGTVWLADWSQLMVAWEVFLMNAYGDYALPEHPATILDLGANVGLASMFFRLRYPDARIVAVEPDRDAARLAERNLRGLDVQIINAAVAPASGTTILYRRPGESWTASTVAGNGERHTVEAIALDSLIERMGEVTIMKVDIEGAEHDVLAASRRLDAVAYIIGEVHPVAGSSTRHFFDILHDFDISVDAIVDGKGTFVACARPKS